MATLAVDNLAEQLQRLARMYGEPIPEVRRETSVGVDTIQASTPAVVVAPADAAAVHSLPTAAALFLISDVFFPVDLRATVGAATPVRMPEPSREDARWFLRYLFRKDDFWEGQWETIERTLRGLDSAVLLPTGGGKSIAFQLAGLLLPGPCIVVDPIVSLIEDQIDNLAQVGIDRCIGITSGLDASERSMALEAFQSGHYLFCYVAPERFQTVPFREALRALTVVSPISLIAVDEAHCVSEWGHDFRTAYLNLGRITREYCATQDVVPKVTPPLVALTGTASRIVLKDVQRELGITDFDAIIMPSTFDRPELRFSVLPAPSAEKTHRVLGFLERLPGEFAVDPSRFFEPSGARSYAGLIFCPHVNGNYGVVEQARQVQSHFRTRADIYSGSSPRGYSSDS